MSITLSWRPLGMKAEQDIDGYVDVVTWVQWSCYGIDLSESGVYTAEQIGEINLPFTPSDQFIPMSKLTDNIVNEWVWSNGVNKPAVEAAVIADIEAQKK